ncbi:MAG TPA: hypothetical protein VKE51_19325 [Vicinamibacterales bacterium]|nr:hypothetical protein [Vicinamibacterales bacterium]
MTGPLRLMRQALGGVEPSAEGSDGNAHVTRRAKPPNSSGLASRAMAADK